MLFIKNNVISAFLQMMLGIALLFIVQNVQVAFVLVFIEFFFLIIRYIAKGFYNNTIYIFFLAFLFTFLMGGFLLNIGSEAYFTLFSAETYRHIAYCLFISMFFSSIIYDYVYSHKREEESISIEQDNSRAQSIKKSALLVFYVFSIFTIAVNAEKALFVRSSSYLAYYTDYATRLPSIFTNLSAISEFAFFVFMATMPRKKECTVPVIWFILIGATSLGFGQRNGFVINLVFVIIYYTIRHKMGGEKWISKRMVIISIIAIPLFISALYSFNYLRSNRDISVSGIGKQAVAFFDEQSSSARVIGYGYEYKDAIKENGVNYSLSQLSNVITQNSIVRRILGLKTYSGHTVENALYGTQFSKAVTYKVMPYNYLAGIGMGTSYIAEAYHDFGYVGLCLVNMLYGLLIALFQRKKFTIASNMSHPYLTAVMFMGMTNILYAPRSIVFGVISLTMNITTLVAVILIQLLSHVKMRRVMGTSKGR